MKAKFVVYSVSALVLVVCKRAGLCREGTENFVAVAILLLSVMAVAELGAALEPK